MGYKKKPNTLTRSREQQAQRDLAEFGEPGISGAPLAAIAQQPAATLPSGAAGAKVPHAAWTHGISRHCPGSIAYGLLGGTVFSYH